MGSVNHSDLTGADLHSPYVRSYSGNPTGSATPNFTGELLWDATNHTLYVAEGATSADWVAAVIPARKLAPLKASPCVATIEGTYDERTVVAWAGAAPAHYQHVVGSGTLIGEATVSTGRANLTRYTNVLIWDSVTATATQLSPGLQLIIQVPPEFTGWDSAGIRLLHKVTWTSGTDEPYYIEIECHDQGLNNHSPRAMDSRTIAAGESDTSFSWLEIPGADLDGLYAAGNHLMIEIKGWKPTVNGGTPNTIRVQLGALELHWNDA